MIGRLATRLGGLFRRREGLKGQIVTSAMLSSGVFVTQVMLRLISTIVLTRILSPEIFGVFAIVMTVVFVFEMLSDLGIRDLVLTKEDELDAAFLRACWTTTILRGLILAGLCVLCALGIAWGQAAEIFGAGTAYMDPVLPWAVAAIGLNSVFSGFNSPNRYAYEREMKFARVSIALLTVNLSTLVAIIGLGLWLQNIWALVLGNLFAAVLTAVLTFVLFEGPTMRWGWHKAHMRMIFERGRWIIGRSGLTALMSIADRVLLGLTVSAETFGFYYIARQIADMTDHFLMAMHNQMGLQVFTALQKGDGPDTDGPEPGADRAGAAAFRQRYYRYRMVFDGIAMFGAGGLITGAPLLVDIIYDDRYAQVATIIQILALGLIFVGPGLLREAFGAQRRFRDTAVLTFVRAASIWGGLAVAVLVLQSEIIALVVIALHRIPETILTLYWGHRAGWVDLLREIRLTPLVALGAATGWAITWAWRALFG